MGEFDMGPIPGSEPGTSVDTGDAADGPQTTEQWAEQRRAEARAPLAEPESDSDSDSHFNTPSWMDRSEVAPVTRAAPYVPAQAAPAHDNLHAYAPMPASDTVPDSAHWTEHRRPRVVIGALLTVSLLGVAGFLVASIMTEAPAAIIGLSTCGFLSVVFRVTLMSRGVTVTDLKGTILKVRRDGELFIFRLDDPDHVIQVVGLPGSRSWKVILEAPDGRIVELDSAHVDAHEMHPIAEYYHAIAEREREQRHYRFNL